MYMVRVREINYLVVIMYLFFFFHDTATTEIYTLSLHDALPISLGIGIAALGTGIGQGIGLSKACEGVARNPGASGDRKSHV